MPGKLIDLNTAKARLAQQGLGGPSPTPAKGKTLNRHITTQAVARFFGLGKNVYQIHRETGVPVAVLQEEIRRIGYRAWERKAMGVAA